MRVVVMDRSGGTGAAAEIRGITAILSPLPGL